MKRRILSIITALALCLSLCPTWALAVEADPSLCKHHPEHTEDCGYTAPTEGHDCGHEHTAACYTLGVLPDADSGAPYQVGGDTENLLDCQHSHDSECGYVQADPGASCGYVCHICPIEDLIAALPEQVTEDNAAIVRGQLDEILDLFTALNEDEQGQLDLSHVTKLQGALDAANAPMAADGRTEQQDTDEASVSINGETLYYATLEEAFAAANRQTATITMLTDAECIKSDSAGSPLNITSGNVTLNLNGKTLSGKGHGYYGIIDVSGGSLLVQGEDGKVKVEWRGLSCRGNGKLIVEGITLELVGDNVAVAGAGVENSGGTVVLNGTQITGVASDGQIYHYSGTTTIHNVTATGTTENLPKSVWYHNEGTLTINGGTFDNIVVESGNDGGVQSVAELLGEGYAYKHQGGSWATAGDLAALEISNVTVEKIPLTIHPQGDTSWYYSTQQTHTLAMNAAPVDSGNSVSYVWKNGETTLDGAADTCEIPAGTPVGSYTYTCEATCDGYTLSHAFSFEIMQSGTQFVGDGEVKTYNGDTLTTSFSAGDTITVKATPTPTGEAPVKAVSRLRGGGKMAVFVGDTRVSAEVDATEDGSYTMTVPAADVLLAANGPGAEIPLTAKFTANDNMADGAGTVTVNITAVAKAERNNAVIGYYGESNFADAFGESNDGATVTLLADVARTANLDIKINCTLDLGGHTIHFTGEAALGISGDVTATIQDQSQDHQGQVISEQSNALVVNGSVTLEGGTFTSHAENCAGVKTVSEKSHLIVTTEHVVMQNTSDGGYGLIVNNAQSVRLSAGTYSGGMAAIATAGITLGSMLAHSGDTRYAYFDESGTNPITGVLNDKSLTGTVTVGECQHTAAEYTPNESDASTHTKTCLACGNTWAAEDCDYGEYTHNDTSHTRICKLCEYQNVEAHNIKCTAEASGTVIAVSEACKTCGYGKDLGTVTIHIPKLVYGDLTGVVTAENTLTEPVSVAGNVKNPLGETVIFSDHAIIDPPTMATLTGNAFLSAGEHKIKINIVIIRDENALAECELTFNVAPAPLTADMVTLSAEGATYNGKEQKPALSVQQGETTLTEGTDYEVSYTRDGVVTNDFTNAGTVNITVTGKGNYGGEVEKTFTIGKATPTITWSSTTQELTFTGQQAAITAPTVTLVNNESFGGTIHYSYTGTTSGTGLPQNAGTYTIKASIAAQDNYTAADSSEMTLTIKPTPVTLTFANQTIAYGDTPTGATADLASAKIEYSYTIEAGGTPISGWPTNAGTYTVTAKVEATGNYGEASKTATLTITPKEVSNPNIELSPNTFVYDGTEKKPAVTVKDGEKVIPASEYTVAYSNNINAGTATVTITNVAGNYTVSGTKTFTITKANQAPLTITGAPSSVTYGDTFQLGVSGGSGTGALSWAASGATVDNAGNVTITRAGTVVITAVKEGDSNYVGTEGRIMLDVDKADLTADGTGTASGTYGAKLSELTVSGLTAKLGEATVTGTWKLAGDTVPNVGDSGEYTATFTPATGAGNYNPLTAKVKLNIAKATAPTPQTGTLNVQNGHAREYTYDLSRLLPVLASGQSFGGEVTYTLKTVNITEAGYYDSDTAAISGTTLTLPVKAVTSSDEGQIGTITVTISSKNFADVDATINVNRVNKQPVSIEGVTAQNGTYNGGTHNGYTGTPTASPYSGGFKVTYAKADGTALSGAPTNAGDYTVTITLNENNDYTGSRTLSFTISKASITIKADDKRADVGTAKPALTYTVTGLASGDTLATEPTLTCDADMNTIGQYPITASGAAVPSGGNYNTAITYVPGTLSVTDPTIPVTGVTLNKTSTTLTVGGSERLTATVAPSDATDKSVTWTSSNTAVATVDASGNITAVSAGTATITVTTADGAKTATCSVTVRSNSGGGSSYVPSTPSDPSTSTITVPVSGDKDTVRVSASVSGTTATVSKIDTSQIENVIGDNGQASMVEIDFTGLGKTIDTVKLPAAAIKDIAEKAQNEEVGGLTVKLPEAEISFDANALSAIQAQAGSQITLTVTPAKPTDLNNRQKEAVGSAPVFDLTLRSSSGAITDFRGGYATVSLPYTLAAGQNPSGVVVYYLDSAGNITPCTTMYDVGRKSAIFTTGHLSLYFVGYDPTAVWVNPFSDVTEGAWYYDAVRYASENGLMGGYGNGKFGPNDNLSRAQFAQILFNKEGRPVVNYLLRYNDVADGAWYTEAVRWATSQGIVGGYGNGMFGPNDNITREQLAVMLWRYAGSPAATEKELHFTDADKASGYALEALRWAVENGVMGGYGNGQLAPQGLATRAQVAQMLMNFLKNR